MRTTISILLCMATASAQVVITSTEATSKEIVVRYEVPPRYEATSPCAVQASYINDFSSAYTPLPDVDPTQFPQSDVDVARNAKLFVGRSRTVVIGKQIPYWRTLPMSATTGYRESLAVKAAGPVFVKITCDRFSDTATVMTKTVPFGLTFAEATPADPNAPGFPNWPSVKWGATQTIIDPEYGTELKRPESAGSRAVANASASFQEASGVSWSNPLNILTDDNNSASISGSQAILSLPWPYGAIPIGSVTQSPGDTKGLDWIQLTLKATSSAGAADDGSIQACLSIDGGAGTCYSPWHDIDVRSCGNGCSYPSAPKPVDHWQAPGGRPIPRQWLASRAGTFQYASASSTVTITGGDHVAETWTSGTKFRAFKGTKLHIASITSGTPLTVTFIEAHGLGTGDSVAISGIDIFGSLTPPPGSCASLANGVWPVTVVDPTTVALNGSGGTCTYGLLRNVDVSGTTPGSPPSIHSVNAFLPPSTYLTFSGFTDSGWTSLNTGFWIADTGGEQFGITGANTTGAYTGGATYKVLTGVAQAFNDYAIDKIADASHFTLASGPAADVSTDTNWSVNPLSVLIRKKTTSADPINLQFAQVGTQTSAGTTWAAAGGEICFPYDTKGAGEKMGSICTIGSTTLWIPRDGTAAQSFGLVPYENSSDLNNLGVSCISGNSGKGFMAINPSDPNRIYCAKYRYVTSDRFGMDQAVYVMEYEGDYIPRTETAAQLQAAYPSYGYAMDAPWLPNCYGDGKLNDGINPRVIPTRCVSYKKIIPSVQAMIAASDTTWQKFVSSTDRLPCGGGSGGQMNFTYRASTNSVWGSINCAPYGDQGGITYVFDLGNERPVSDPSSTVRLAAPMDSWSRVNERWTKFHGGAGLHDGYIQQTPHPVGIWSGVSNSYAYTDDQGRRCYLCGPFWTTYTSVDGTPGAPLTNTLQSCAPWAGSPYLPNPVPDGKAGQGCNTVTVAGEPGDDTPDPEEQVIMAANPSLHQSKTGAAGKYWLQDAIVGDIVLIDHDADRDYQHIEPAIVIAKNGNSWVLYRGGAKRVNNGSGGYAGTIDHTGDTQRLIMSFSYDTTTGAYPQLIKPYDPPGPGLLMRLTMGHGAGGNTLTAGSTVDGTNYGVVRGTLQQRVSATSFDFTVASRGLPFEGKSANNVLSTDSHMTFVESAALTNKDPWIVDCAPWNGYEGTPATGPVAGTRNVYKWTGAQLNSSVVTNQFPKFLAPEVRIGVWVARNISGPNSVINDTKPYTFCEVYAPGECMSGSAAGDVYVSAPLLDQPGSKFQCCGNDYTAVRDLSISSASETFSRCTQTVLRNDSTGSTGRALTTSLHTPRAEDSFKNMSVTNTGLLGVMRERGVEFVKSELFAITMPPIVFDGIDRTHFWRQAIPIRPYFGADNVLVRFGYAHYGDVTAGQYYCTTRQESCVIGAATSPQNPFYFETTDTYGGISCTTDCTATLPLIPNRVAYYEVIFRSGTTVLYTTPQQVVVSP